MKKGHIKSLKHIGFRKVVLVIMNTGQPFFKSLTICTKRG